METALGTAAGVETGLGLGLDDEEEEGAGGFADELGGLKKAKSDCCPLELLAVALGGMLSTVRGGWGEGATRLGTRRDFCCSFVENRLGQATTGVM